MTLVATEVLEDTEYEALVAAVSAAEQSALYHVELFLGNSQELGLHLEAVPDSRFPAKLHAKLQELAIERKRAHSELRFPLNLLPHISQICNSSLPDPLIRLINIIQKRKQSPPDDIPQRIGKHLWDALLPFQRTGVNKAITLGNSVLFADDMGLGKTLQALAVAEYHRNKASRDTKHGENGDDYCFRKCALVLCPAMLRDDWLRAITRWLPHTPAASVQIVSSGHELLRIVKARAAGPRDEWDCAPPLAYVVCSYDTLPNVLEQLRQQRVCNGISSTYPDELVPNEMRFPLVIADECHLLRNMSTSRTMSSLPVILAAKYRILISGTPALSRPIELYPQLHALLSPNVADSPFLLEDFFRNRYCRHASKQCSPPHRNRRLQELGAILTTVMIRREKREVTKDLPPKNRTRIVVQLSRARIQSIQKAQDELWEIEAELNASSIRAANQTLIRSRREALYRRLYSETGVAKIPSVIARVRQLLFDPQYARRKLLIFAHHLQVLDAIEALVRREQVQYIRLDGTCPNRERQGLVSRFQSQVAVRVGILSVAVAGTGITLTAADCIVFAELEWVPGLLIQAEDRAHRIGRRGPINIEYITAKETLDDRMWACLERKLRFVGNIFDSHLDQESEVSDMAWINMQSFAHCGDTETAITDAVFDVRMLGLLEPAP